MAPATSPKPPMMVAANAFRAMVEPMTASYGVALWVMTRAPVALVAALRETSVLFATIFAAVFLKERLGLARCAAVVLVTAGAIVMKSWR